MKANEFKYDAGKLRLTLVPRQIVQDIAAVREYGVRNKYKDKGIDAWRKVEVERFDDALYRHFMDYLDEPNGVDKESGLPHYAHVACNIAFICELRKELKDVNNN